MPAILNFDLRDGLSELRDDGRLAVLIALTLHANLRMRCYPSIDLLVKETGWSVASVSASKKWLAGKGAIVLVPYDKRVDDELILPPRQHVYQLTGVLHLEKGVIPYLYLSKEVQDQVNILVAKTLASKILPTITEDSTSFNLNQDNKQSASANAASLSTGDIEMLRYIAAHYPVSMANIPKFEGVTHNVATMIDMGLIYKTDTPDMGCLYSLTADGVKLTTKKERKRDPLYDVLNEQFYNGAGGSLVGRAKKLLVKEFPDVTGESLSIYVEWYKTTKRDKSGNSLHLPRMENLPPSYGEWVKAGKPLLNNTDVKGKKIHATDCPGGCNGTGWIEMLNAMKECEG